jgi:phosphopantothenoylcysteine synthetase/decarboxylase
VLVGFALETPAARTEGHTGEMREEAHSKLEAKRLDLVVLNGPGAMGSQTSSVSVLRRGGAWEDWGETDKQDHARRIVALAAEIALARGPRK